uniref:(northern house mosquito) hypothetical protein n=1 Tax=Culex pipiens TaxID=7175 RepID=A0A8D8J154_CULPI
MQSSARRQLLGPALLGPEPSLGRLDERRRAGRRVSSTGTILPTRFTTTSVQHFLQRSRTSAQQFAQVLPLANALPRGSIHRRATRNTARIFRPRVEPLEQHHRLMVRLLLLLQHPGLGLARPQVPDVAGAAAAAGKARVQIGAATGRVRPAPSVAAVVLPRGTASPGRHQHRLHRQVQLAQHLAVALLHLPKLLLHDDTLVERKHRQPAAGRRRLRRPRLLALLVDDLFVDVFTWRSGKPRSDASGATPAVQPVPAVATAERHQRAHRAGTGRSVRRSPRGTRRTGLCRRGTATTRVEDVRGHIGMTERHSRFVVRVRIVLVVTGHFGRRWLETFHGGHDVGWFGDGKSTLEGGGILVDLLRLAGARSGRCRVNWMRVAARAGGGGLLAAEWDGIVVRL